MIHTTSLPGTVRHHITGHVSNTDVLWGTTVP